MLGSASLGRWFLDDSLFTSFEDVWFDDGVVVSSKVALGPGLAEACPVEPADDSAELFIRAIRSSADPPARSREDVVPASHGAAAAGRVVSVVALDMLPDAFDEFEQFVPDAMVGKYEFPVGSCCVQMPSIVELLSRPKAFLVLFYYSTFSRIFHQAISPENTQKEEGTTTITHKFRPL